MSMFPHWFGSQKQAVPQFDTTCPNCRRRFELAMSPDACPFCESKLAQRAADLRQAAQSEDQTVGRTKPTERRSYE